MRRRLIGLFLLLAAPASWAAPGSGGAARQAQDAYVRATLLERRGAYPEALAAYEKAIALDPSSAFLVGEAAELALGLGDRAKAESLARRRLALAPEDPRSRLILGRVLWMNGDVAGAESEFARALSSGGATPDQLFQVVELTAGRVPAKARALLERFLAGHPDDAAQAYFELGRLDAQEERWTESARELRRSISLDDAQSGPARLTLAQVYEVLGDTRAAIAQYQRLLLDAPGDPDIWARVGELQAAAGDREAAAATFRALKARHPDDPAACAWLAGEAEKAGDFRTAAAILKDSAALRDDPTLVLRLSYYQLQAGGMKAAMATLLAARRRWPKDDRVAYYLALGYDDRGDHGKAVALLKEVLALKPDDRDARWQLAAILEQMGRWDEAEPQFRRLIADKPDDAPALNYLGYSLADRGLKLEEAEGLVRRALALEPSNPAYRDSLGWALFKLGRSTEAVHELAASIVALPDDGEVWEHLGEALRVQGRVEPAWRAFRMAQSLGSAKAGSEADALQEGWDAARLGESWRRHLEAAHGGVRRWAGVCALEGRVAGHDVSLKVLADFRRPRLTVEILGPLLVPAAGVSADSTSFSMDGLRIPGLSDEQVRASAGAALESVAAVLAGVPFAPGAARFERGWWGKRFLERPDWRVRLGKDALARSVRPAAGSTEIELKGFQARGARRVPDAFAAKGRFWSLSLSCPRLKIELDDADPLAGVAEPGARP